MGKAEKEKNRGRDSVIGLNLSRHSEELQAQDEETSDDKAIAEQPSAEAEALAKIEKERNEYYDLLLRKQAEFENFRKRTLREREESRTAIRAEILSEILPIIDASEKGMAAMKHDSVPTPCLPFVEGYELLLRQLQSLLEKHDVTPVPGVGSTFDPNLHEAVLREVTRDCAENEIVEEYRKGYLIGDRLLRPSQVKVAVWPEEGE